MRFEILIPAVLAALLALPGCPGDDDDTAGDDDTTAGDDDVADDDSAGDDDDTTPAGPWDTGWPIETTLDGQAMIEGSFDGTGPIWWALDTGAARTYVDSAITGTTNNVSGDVVVGPLEFPDHQVGSVDLAEAEAFIGWDLGGLAGQDLFSDRFTALDYAGLQAHFLDEVPAEPPPGSSLAVPEETPYELPSSIPVATFTLAGADGSSVDVALIADTGSGVTLITEEIFEQLDDGTLPQLEGYVWATNYGTDDGFLTRIPTVGVTGGELGADGTWAVVIPADNHLFPLLRAAGIDAVGFIGFPFYREFVVGVDGFEDRYLWWPQDDLSHIDPHEWQRVGVEPSWREGQFFVEMLYSPSDAEDQGLEVGDRIVRVDGDDLAGGTLDDLKGRLRGAPGTAVELVIEREGVEQPFTVEIQDLLPALETP